MSDALQAPAPTKLEWRNGEPFSSQFGDIYFNPSAGPAESRYVFIDQNQLPQRWSDTQLTTFTIAETGFGSGLNFLSAAQLWLEQTPLQARLHYLSVEAFPLARPDLKRIWQRWPQFSELSAELTALYPCLAPGYHRLFLGKGRVRLDLLLGEASDALEQLRDNNHPDFEHSRHTCVDAWFLDGFAPAKNPDMWRDHLFDQILGLSHRGTTFATFTAAGAVRRALQVRGFAVEKVPGFGNKREMLRGVLEAPIACPPQATTPAPRNTPQSPWYLPSDTPTIQARGNNPAAPKQAIVIGAGIAGCTSAAALAARGWQVRIYEQHGEPATGASGNPQGIVYPKISPQRANLSRVNLAALLFASRYYSEYWGAANTPSQGQRCGVVILPENDKQARQLRQIADNFKTEPGFVSLVEGQALQTLTGLPLHNNAGLYYPQLGWIAPRAVCEAMIDKPNIELIRANVAALELDANGKTWTLFDQQQNQLTSANTVIIAAGTNSAMFPQSQHLPLKAIRGQISIAARRHSEAGRALKTVICGAAYVAPPVDGRYCFGATYDLHSQNTAVTTADHHANLQGLEQSDPALPLCLHLEDLSCFTGQAALRCASPDYLPLVGRIANFRPFCEDYAALRYDARRDIARAGNYWPGLYTLCGLGSRGLSYAPLAAELLASQICGETLPLERELAIALNPARFIIRDLKRNKI